MTPSTSFDLSPILRELEKNDYRLAKVLPVVPKKIPGISELGIFLNMWTEKRTNIFNPAYFLNLLQLIFRYRYPTTYILFDALLKNDPIPPERLSLFFSEEELATFIGQGIVTELDDGRLRFEIRIIPFMDKLLVTDRFDRSTKGLTYCGIDSLIMAEENRAQFLGQRHFKSCLDIGTGAGIQAICASGYCRKVSGIDINPRAITYAKINAGINNLDKRRFRKSDLFSGVKEKYDLILSNPPFMFYPKSELEKEEHLDGDGGMYGLEVVGNILDNIDHYLEENGVARIIAQSPIVGNHDMLREMVNDKFSSLPYHVTIKPLCYFINPTHFHFYRKHGIRYNILCLITLVKGQETYKLSINEMPILRKLADFAKIGMIYCVK